MAEVIARVTRMKRKDVQLMIFLQVSMRKKFREIEFMNFFVKPIFSDYRMRLDFQRSGQPNWEFWMQIFHNVEILQFVLILREINFGWFQRVKNCPFDNFVCFEFWFFGNFSLENVKKIQKFKIQSYSNGQNGSV